MKFTPTEVGWYSFVSLADHCYNLSAILFDYNGAIIKKVANNYNGHDFVVTFYVSYEGVNQTYYLLSKGTYYGDNYYYVTLKEGILGTDNDYAYNVILGETVSIDGTYMCIFALAIEEGVTYLIETTGDIFEDYISVTISDYDYLYNEFAHGYIDGNLSYIWMKPEDFEGDIAYLCFYSYSYIQGYNITISIIE